MASKYRCGNYNCDQHGKLFTAMDPPSPKYANSSVVKCRKCNRPAIWDCRVGEKSNYTRVNELAARARREGDFVELKRLQRVLVAMED